MSQVISSLQDSETNILHAFLIFRAHALSHPTHPPSFDNANDMWQSVRVMKLLILQESISLICNSCKNDLKICFNMYCYSKYIWKTKTITAQYNIRRIPKIAHVYSPTLTRDLGRPRTRRETYSTLETAIRHLLPVHDERLIHQKLVLSEIIAVCLNT